MVSERAIPAVLLSDLSPLPRTAALGILEKPRLNPKPSTSSKTNMAITVQNITATSAIINWLPMTFQKCLGRWSSLMYHPNWNSHLMGYTLKNVRQEDRIPLNQTTASLEDLLPQTSYIVCVTCQSARPTRDQCRVFSTMDSGEDLAGSHRDPTMVLWLVSTIILLIISAPLLWACFHSIWPDRRNSTREGQPRPTASNQELGTENWGKETRLPPPNHGEDDAHHVTVIENPFHSDSRRELMDEQDQELWTLDRLNDPE